MAVQASHVAIQFAHEHPEIELQWFSISNYIAILEVENEDELLKLKDKIISADLKYSQFLEPDLDNSLTALTIEPGKTSKKLVRYLPLAFS